MNNPGLSVPIGVLLFCDTALLYHSLVMGFWHGWLFVHIGIGIVGSLVAIVGQCDG